jgi:hypothetical protein
MAFRCRRALWPLDNRKNCKQLESSALCQRSCALTTSPRRGIATRLRATSHPVACETTCKPPETGPAESGDLSKSICSALKKEVAKASVAMELGRDRMEAVRARV